MVELLGIIADHEMERAQALKKFVTALQPLAAIVDPAEQAWAEHIAAERAAAEQTAAEQAWAEQAAVAQQATAQVTARN